MKKRVLTILFLILFSFSLCGCDIINTNLETLLKPPALNDEQSNIYKAVSSTLNPNETISFQSPQIGDYRSSIVLYNMTSTAQDTEKEAIVFFKKNLQNGLTQPNLQIAFLDHQNNRWEVKKEITKENAEINEVQFYKDQQTKESFAILSFVREQQTQNDYSVFQYINGTFEEIYNDVYQMLEVYDINGDGQDEMICISYPQDANDKDTLQNNKSLAPTARVIQYQSGQFIAIDQTDMSGKATSYYNVIKDEKSFQKPALLLDEQVSKTTYGTEILTYENGKLTNLIFNKNNNLFEETMRTQVPICYDFNNDSIIEIPKTEYFPGYTMTSDNPMYQTKWYQLNHQALQQVALSYVNYSQGFGFLLPKNWDGKVTIKLNENDNQIDFVIYDRSLENSTQKILSIKISSLKDIETSGIPTDYAEIQTIGQSIYLAKIYKQKDANYQLTMDDVKKQFIQMYVSLNNK